jgi:hypothetical protein
MFFLIMKSSPLSKLSKEQLDILKYINDPVLFARDLLGLEVEPFHEEWFRAFETNRFLVLLAPRGHGKEQPLSSLILTPNGWKRMGDIKVGSYVIGFNGKQTKVTGVYPQGKKQIYKIITSDGRCTRCGANHLWMVQTPSNTGNKFVIKSTKELIQNYFANRIDKRNGKSYIEYRHFIPTVNPIDFPERILPIDPYTLGSWLGDGNSRDGRYTSNDEELISFIPYKPRKLKSKYM